MTPLTEPQLSAIAFLRLALMTCEQSGVSVVLTVAQGETTVYLPSVTGDGTAAGMEAR